MGESSDALAKPRIEFLALDMNDGWQSHRGYPLGVQQKVLASDLDETRKTGNRNRLPRFAPRGFTTAPPVHYQDRP